MSIVTREIMTKEEAEQAVTKWLADNGKPGGFIHVRTIKNKHEFVTEKGGMVWVGDVCDGMLPMGIHTKEDNDKINNYLGFD